jgi:hypothetical protein
MGGGGGSRGVAASALLHRTSLWRETSQPQQPLNGENAKLTFGHFGKRVKYHGGSAQRNFKRSLKACGKSD